MITFFFILIPDKNRLWMIMKQTKEPFLHKINKNITLSDIKRQMMKHGFLCYNWILLLPSLGSEWTQSLPRQSLVEPHSWT